MACLVAVGVDPARWARMTTNPADFFDEVETLEDYSLTDPNGNPWGEPGTWLKCTRSVTGAPEGVPPSVTSLLPVEDDSPEARDRALRSGISEWWDFVQAKELGWTPRPADEAFPPPVPQRRFAREAVESGRRRRAANAAAEAEKAAGE